MRLLRKLNDTGKTIIMVTHENDIAAWARRVVRMRDGHIESDVRNERPLVKPGSREPNEQRRTGNFQPSRVSGACPPE